MSVARPGVSRPRIVSGVRWKYVLIPLTITWALAFVGQISISLVIANPQFLRETGLVGHAPLLGLLSSVFLVSYGISAYFWGMAVDRWGPRRTMLLAIALLALTEFGFASSHNVVELFVSRTFLGVAEGFSWPVSLAITARWFPLRERAVSNGIWLDGCNVGTIACFPPMVAMMVTMGWAAPFWALGAATIVILMPIYLWLFRDSPEVDSRVGEKERELIASDQFIGKDESDLAFRLNQVFLGAPFWLLTVIGICGGFETFGLTTWIPSYLVQARHVAFAHAGWFSSLPFFWALILMPLLSYLETHYGRVVLWNLGVSLLMAFCLWMGLVVPSALASALLLGAAFGMGVTFSVSANTVLHTLAPSKHMGKVGGLLQGVSQLMSFFGPFGMGLMIGLAGSKFIGGFLLALVVALLSAACSVALIVTLRSKSHEIAKHFAI